VDSHPLLLQLLLRRTSLFLPLTTQQLDTSPHKADTEFPTNHTETPGHAQHPRNNTQRRHPTPTPRRSTPHQQQRQRSHEHPNTTRSPPTPRQQHHTSNVISPPELRTPIPLQQPPQPAPLNTNPTTPRTHTTETWKTLAHHQHTTTRHNHLLHSHHQQRHTTNPSHFKPTKPHHHRNPPIPLKQPTQPSPQHHQHIIPPPRSLHLHTPPTCTSPTQA
jgi:hypothetical protein